MKKILGFLFLFNFHVVAADSTDWIQSFQSVGGCIVEQSAHQKITIFKHKILGKVFDAR